MATSVNDHDVMDQDIQRLLLEAEERLRTTEPSEASSDTEASKTIVSSIPKLLSKSSLQPYVRQHDGLATAETSNLLNVLHKDGLEGSRSTSMNMKTSTAEKEQSHAGNDWFNLPKTELTPELKREFQLLRMRSVLDPKRHYKKENGKFSVPAYSQVGTIIQGPTEFWSSRIIKKDRRKTFVEEALALERETGRFKSKYRDIQTTKQSGKKSYYGSLRAKRNIKGK